MIGSRLVRTAALSAVAGLALTGCSVYDLPLPGGAKVDQPMTVHVKFRDVLDLVPQSTVKVDDVTVGKVTGITLQGYSADVAISIPKALKLPANTHAEIRQTSLLGEKFVDLKAPETGATGLLTNGATIGLESTGRNPEIEEVLGALAALLNGGGVGQLKIIAEELNTTVGGRESEIRSVLTQIHSFMGQLDQNKASIVSAIENLNRLAVQLRQQDGSIKLALDNIPAALRSIDSQRADLIKMLKALSNLSGVGVRVINASKVSTINSLRDLAPILSELAKAGDAFPKSLQVFLTYPFVDEAIGRDPAVARNLHMGDYTNLSIRLDLNLAALPAVPGLPSLPDLANLCKQTPLDPLCKALGGALGGLPGVGGVLGGGTGGGSLPSLPGLGGTTTTTPKSGSTGSGSSGGSGGLLGGLGLGRAQLGAGYLAPVARDPYGLRARGMDSGVGTLLLQGVSK